MAESDVWPESVSGNPPAQGDFRPATRDFGSPQFSIEAIRRELECHGVAVIENIMDVQACDDRVTEIRQWLAGFGTSFPDNITSIIHKYKIGFSEPVWRTREAVKPAFSSLWGTDKLLCSTDGLAIGQPLETGNDYGFPKNIPNLHHDQGAEKVGLHVFQGAVYLEEALEDDWCFVVMDKSHKYHKEFFDSTKSTAKSEHRRLSPKEITWFEKRGCPMRRIPVPKGGMVIWDSRTVHAGAPPKPGRENPGRWRFVVFVCMGPAIWATEHDMKTKQESFLSMKMSNHWPCNAVKLSLFCHKESAFDIVKQPECTQSKEVQLMAGLETYDFENEESNGPNWIPHWRN